MEKPEILEKLKTNPESVISSADLSEEHKKILLSGNATRVKNIVGRAAAQMKFYPHIQAAAYYHYIVIKHQAADVERIAAKPFNIVIGSGKSKVGVGLKHKFPRSGKISKSNPVSMTAFAIHITSAATPGDSSAS